MSLVATKSRLPITGSMFVFEGPDGVGKSTLASHLRDRLNQRGFPTDGFSFPGAELGTLGEHIYRLYHNPESVGISTISVTAEQLLFTAAHTDVIENRILPALSSGRNVVLDRYWWSTWVYSTLGGLDPAVRQLLIDLELAVWRDVRPDCIFLVRRNRPSDSEHTVGTWQTLASLYEDILAQQAGRTRALGVDNDGDIEDAVEIVWQAARTRD